MTTREIRFILASQGQNLSNTQSACLPGRYSMSVRCRYIAAAVFTLDMQSAARWPIFVPGGSHLATSPLPTGPDEATSESMRAIHVAVAGILLAAATVGWADEPWDLWEERMTVSEPLRMVFVG